MNNPSLTPSIRLIGIGVDGERPTGSLRRLGLRVHSPSDAHVTIGGAPHCQVPVRLYYQALSNSFDSLHAAMMLSPVTMLSAVT